MDIIKITTQPKKYIGYWRKSIFDFTSEYPYPIPNFFTLEDQTELIQKTKNVLQKHSYTESYFGYSNCRLCGLKNGISEYWIDYQDITYIIPIGYFHYLEQHNVKMDDKLIEITNYYVSFENV